MGDVLAFPEPKITATSDPWESWYRSVRRNRELAEKLERQRLGEYGPTCPAQGFCHLHGTGSVHDVNGKHFLE